MRIPEAIGHVGAQDVHRHAIVDLPACADAAAVAVENRDFIALDRTLEGKIEHALRRTGEGCVPRARKAAAFGGVAQLVRALHRHVDRARGLFDQAGFGERLDKAALHVRRPAIGARAARHRAPFELGRIEGGKVERRLGRLFLLDDPLGCGGCGGAPGRSGRAVAGFAVCHLAVWNIKRTCRTECSIRWRGAGSRADQANCTRSHRLP